MKQIYYYAAFSDTTDTSMYTYNGTLKDTKKKARKLANDHGFKSYRILEYCPKNYRVIKFKCIEGIEYEYERREYGKPREAS